MDGIGDVHWGVLWHTVHILRLSAHLAHQTPGRRNGAGDSGGSGGGRRGYAQLDRASTFEDDGDGDNSPSSVNSTHGIGQSGTNPV